MKVWKASEVFKFRESGVGVVVRFHAPRIGTAGANKNRPLIQQDAAPFDHENMLYEPSLAKGLKKDLIIHKLEWRLLAATILPVDYFGPKTLSALVGLKDARSLDAIAITAKNIILTDQNISRIGGACRASGTGLKKLNLDFSACSREKPESNLFEIISALEWTPNLKTLGLNLNRSDFILNKKDVELIGGADKFDAFRDFYGDFANDSDNDSVNAPDNDPVNAPDYDPVIAPASHSDGDFASDSDNGSVNAPDYDPVIAPASHSDGDFASDSNNGSVSPPVSHADGEIEDINFFESINDFEGFEGPVIPLGFEGLVIPEGFEDPVIPEGPDPEIPEGFEGPVIPEGPDPEIPEGFEGPEIPEGFEGPVIPEGPDPEIPEGFEGPVIPEGPDPEIPEGFEGPVIPEGPDPEIVQGGKKRKAYEEISQLGKTLRLLPELEEFALFMENSVINSKAFNDLFAGLLYAKNLEKLSLCMANAGVAVNNNDVFKDAWDKIKLKTALKDLRLYLGFNKKFDDQVFNSLCAMLRELKNLENIKLDVSGTRCTIDIFRDFVDVACELKNLKKIEILAMACEKKFNADDVAELMQVMKWKGTGKTETLVTLGEFGGVKILNGLVQYKDLK